jgi:hypothetical protein
MDSQLLSLERQGLGLNTDPLSNIEIGNQASELSKTFFHFAGKLLVWFGIVQVTFYYTSLPHLHALHLQAVEQFKNCAEQFKNCFTADSLFKRLLYQKNRSQRDALSSV